MNPHACKRDGFCAIPGLLLRWWYVMPRQQHKWSESILGIWRLNLAILSVAFLVLSPIWFSVQAQTSLETRTFRIGVQASAGATRALEEWRTTEAILNAASARENLPYAFSIVPEVSSSITDSLRAGRLDLLLTDPAAFVVAEVGFGARALLSTARIINGRSVDQTGALIFTRADAPINSLVDLQGRRVMAVAATDFSGWWLAAQEFRRFRLEPMDHLGEVLFSGGNEREVVYAVQSGLVDAGVIRAGALEELANAGAIALSDFRPISLQPADGFPYWSSTPLYPERVLSALPSVPDPVLSIVINTLLELDVNTDATGQNGTIAWQAPANYQGVHDLLISLRAPPYENYIWQAIVRIYHLYRWPIYAFVLVTLGSLVFLAYQARKNWLYAEVSRNVLKSESRSKVFYRNAIEEHTVFCMLTRDGMISHANERFCELADQSRSSLLGQELSAFLSERDQAVLADEIQEAMALKTPWNGHLRIHKSNNSYSWAQCTVIPVTGVEDQLSEIALVATDMTSTQQDVVEHTFNDTLELIEDPVIVLEPKTLSLTYCNRAADEILIKNRVGGDWKDRPIEELITHDDLKALRMRCEAVVEGPQRRITWEVDTKDERSYEISLEYVLPDMDAPSLVVMYRDVTERKAAERAKNEFVSTVSHELRTPLTSMKGALKIASSGMVGEVPEKMQDLLGMAARNTDRLVTLINDILDLEKIEAMKMPFNLEKLEMEEVISQAVAANSFYAQKFNVTLEIDIDDTSAPYVTMGDKDRLLQVMDNLLSNAAKFSHEGGVVKISLFRYKDWIRMSVRDFGTGIPQSSQTKIFDKFVQSDSSDSRSKGGTGLGLAIVKPIIEAHNGAISFHSTENVGTEFYVDLPRVDGEAVSKVDVLESPIVPHFIGNKTEEESLSTLTSSMLVQEFEKRLRRSGWGTELEAGRVTTNQILNGSGVLGHAIAINLLNSDCRTLISELIDLKKIDNSPVFILEAELGQVSETVPQNNVRGSQVILDWVHSIPRLLKMDDDAEALPLRILLIFEETIQAVAREFIVVDRVGDIEKALGMLDIHSYDLILDLRETEKDCTALVMPTTSGTLADELPMTLFAGQKTNPDIAMGVVSKFSRRSDGRARRTS